jgi:DNA-binding beta-propeller fold protein YncE
MPRTGSTIALATVGGRTLAYAADEDDQSVHVIDVDGQRELGETALAGRPSQLMFLPDGRLVVLLRDRSELVVLESNDDPATLEARCSVETAPEPVALALTPDDRTVLVTSGWGRTLAGFDGSGLARTLEVSLAREPRAVVASDDGKYAYVSHAVGGKASRVDLAAARADEVSLHGHDVFQRQQMRQMKLQIAQMQQRGTAVPASFVESLKTIEQGEPSCQGFALAKSADPGGRILAPQVLVQTGDSSQRSPGYGNDQQSTEVPDVAVIDEASGEPLATSLERGQDRFGWGRGDPRDAEKPECLLPRAAAYDAAGKNLLVTCLGIDQVIAYDGLSASPARAERRRWSVAAGPNGIAVEPERARAVVWSQFDRALDVVDLSSNELVDDKGQPQPLAPRIAMPKSDLRKTTDTVALGRQLFHAVGDTRISRDGRACASCHPDGRDDALVWSTPEGPRRSIMLAGRLEGTAPYAWSGAEKDLADHLAITFDRLNGESGLKSMELEALMAFVQSLPPPPVTSRGADATKVLRGKELFASTEVGCSSCHGGKAATDGLRHDVSSKTKADLYGNFNTPTLHLVGGTGPYFHDGRYKSLRELLTSNDDKMGRTKQLSPGDLEALEIYVGTL